jgi:hypothetical protein
MKTTSRPATLMIGSLVVTAVLYALPFGRVLAWPLVLLSTLAHELGHGLAAAVLGGHFEGLRMYPDASGVATWSGPLGRLGVATVAGAGLVGPALAAFCLLAFGRTPRAARTLLGCVGTGLVVVALLVARNAFALVFILIVAAACSLSPAARTACRRWSSSSSRCSSRSPCSRAATTCSPGRQ